jgi:hypothetical protein
MSAPSCSICGGIPDLVLVTLTGGVPDSEPLPAGCEKLVAWASLPKPLADQLDRQWRDSKVTRCPECGALFRYSTDHEYLMVTEDTIEVERIRDAQAIADIYREHPPPQPRSDEAARAERGLAEEIRAIESLVRARIIAQHRINYGHAQPSEVVELDAKLRAFSKEALRAARSDLSVHSVELENPMDPGFNETRSYSLSDELAEL